MRKLEGRVALVTGSGKNIGRATALALAELGADVVVHGGSDRKAVDQTVNDVTAHGVKSVGVIGDVGKWDDVQRFTAEGRKALGPITILVCNAAIRPNSPFLDMTVEQWRQVIATNLDAAFYLSKAVLPDMVAAGKGSIITTSGSAAVGRHGERVHVSASKAGLHGLTKGLAQEFAGRGIRVNCVAPGSIGTERAHPEWYPHRDFSQDSRTQGIPLGRQGKPEEIAALCAFLSTDDAGYITGQVIFCNGGMYM